MIEVLVVIDDNSPEATYSTVNPDSDGQVIARLSAGRADDVQGQAILGDRVVESRGVGTITKADVAVFGGITRFVPRLVERLGRCEAKRTSRGLSVGDTEEEFLLVVLVAHTEIRSIAKIDGWCARHGIRVRLAILG